MERRKRRPAAVLTEVALIAAALVGVTLLLRLCFHCYWRAEYPDTYREEVCAAAEQYDVPPSLVFAVIHTESGFRETAVSSAGAIGLMQVTKTTLDWATMRTGGDQSLTADDLTDPAVNIRVGTSVLMLLSQHFENGDTALAAYNAGIGTVGGWLKDPAYSADGVTLSAIPYPETAGYVQKVRRAQKMYQTLYGFA